MKALIASIFAASLALAGLSAHAADATTDGAIVSSTTDTAIVTAALSTPVDVVANDDKKTDDEKKSD